MPSFGEQSRSNLPSALSSFVGRGREIAEVERLLWTTRLLTLTGPGGCGKTRLALAAVQVLSPRFQDGIWLTEFAPLAEAGLVPQAVAVTLGVQEQSGRSFIETLSSQLEGRQVLLVFDNCEHLAAACAQLADALLRACPNLRILATSRETLNVPGETVWVVPPLSLPDAQPWRSPASTQQALAAFQDSEAIQLFVDRAAAASSSFRLTVDNGPWLAEICRRLEGMPLAIELAAARARALSVQEIAERLAERDRFHLLTGGSRTAPPRQQSLEATLDWSFSLLPASEQQLLLRLSVFAGGWSLEAAEAVCCADGVALGDVLILLSHLVDKSLVQANTGLGETRYRMLETIRQYAQRKLAEAGETVHWRDRHLDYFIEWAERAEPNLERPDRLDWLSRFETEHDNLRAALAWALAHPARADKSLQLAGRLGLFWRLHGYHTEGRAQLEAALANPAADTPQNTAARLSILLWAGWLAFFQSDFAAVRALGETRLALCRQLGEAGRLDMAHTLEMLAEIDTEEGDYATAQARYEQALDILRPARDSGALCNTLTLYAWLAMRTGDYGAAGARFEAALNECRAFGDPLGIAQVLAGSGELAVRQGLYARATALLEESLSLRRRNGEPWGIAISLGTLGWVDLLQHNFTRMRERLAESLDIRRDSGDLGGIAWCLEKLAEAACLEGWPQRAARLFGAAAALRARLNAAMDGADLPHYERQLAAVRGRLAPDAFAAAWAEGSGLTVEQAIGEALSKPPAAGEPLPPGATADDRWGGLPARERQVAALIAQGRSNREIAETMVISVKTVETYVTRILNKLGYDSRVQIATWAVEKGQVPSNPE